MGEGEDAVWKEGNERKRKRQCVRERDRDGTRQRNGTQQRTHPTNTLNQLKEPFTSSGLNLLVVELPLVLGVDGVEGAHLQPARLQRESRSQLLQSRLLLVLEDVPMLSDLLITHYNCKPRKCSHADCGR